MTRVQSLKGNRFSGHPLCYCNTLDESTCDFCSGTRLDPFCQLAISWAEEAQNCERRAAEDAEKSCMPFVDAIVQKQIAITLRRCSQALAETIKEHYK